MHAKCSIILNPRKVQLQGTHVLNTLENVSNDGFVYDNKNNCCKKTKRTHKKQTNKETKTPFIKLGYGWPSGKLKVVITFENRCLMSTEKGAQCFLDLNLVLIYIIDEGAYAVCKCWTILLENATESINLCKTGLHTSCVVLCFQACKFWSEKQEELMKRTASVAEISTILNSFFSNVSTNQDQIICCCCFFKNKNWITMSQVTSCPTNQLKSSCMLFDTTRQRKSQVNWKVRDGNVYKNQLRSLSSNWQQLTDYSCPCHRTFHTYLYISSEHPPSHLI